MQQEFELPVDQAKCAHSPCWCIAQQGDYYCSQTCKEESTEQDHQLQCDCPHNNCEGHSPIANGGTA
jgi:hypothetical protein